MSIRVNPLGSAAAEILGLDCARPLTDQAFQVVEFAFLDYPVLVFRDQLLSATDVARFGSRFGPLEGYGTPATTAGSKTEAPKRELAALRQIDGRETPDLMLYVSPSDPDVLIMSNEIRSDLNAIGIVDNAETWHSDASHRAQPCKAVVLYATRNPSAGGDTEFCDMRSVYNALAADLKAELAGRTAIHHWSKSKNPRFAGTLDAAAHEEGERIVTGDAAASGAHASAERALKPLRFAALHVAYRRRFSRALRQASGGNLRARRGTALSLPSSVARQRLGDLGQSLS
jgi:alpha-ketoglutarate-dependent taurine dioxygenase